MVKKLGFRATQLILKPQKSILGTKSEQLNIEKAFQSCSAPPYIEDHVPKVR